VNTLGPILLGSIAHATGFALVGTLVYLAWRRFSPAAGSVAAGSCLLIMALVSLVALSPWPRWRFFGPLESERLTAISAAANQQPFEAALPQPRHESALDPEGAAAGAASHLSPRNDSSATAARIRVFIDELIRDLRRPAPPRDPARWGWTGWLTVGFFAALSLGLARLVLGIWAIQRLRLRSQPIDDRELSDAIAILRAELSCPREVEARETADLASPATIGWRQPIVLLPYQWRNWNHAERLAVLAHEIAHVRRGDFVAGLASQLSLALHFYHPLAHWLAARLRLEQELAADAWAAQLTGGKHAYLTTLAHMALRPYDRSLTWPARAFLPSRGTFVRRIEMLRNTSPIRHGSLSIPARVLTISALAALGLAVAGLRGPSASVTAHAELQQSTPASPAVIGVDSPNLAFVPAEAKMVLAIRPNALLKRRELRSLADKFKQIAPARALQAVPIEDVDQLLAFWEGMPDFPAGAAGAPILPPPSGVVLRMTKPQEWKALLNQLLGSLREARHAGQTYLTTAEPRAAGWAAFAADDRTLVLARDDLLRELIEDRNAPPPSRPWDEAWQKVGKGQIMLALETRWIRRRLAQGFPGAAGAPGQAPASDVKLDTISPLFEKAQTYALSLDTSEGLAIDLVAAARSDNDAKPVADTILALLTFARNAVSGMRQNLRGQPIAAVEAVDWALQAADNLFDKARIETSARFVHVQAKAPLNLAEGAELLAPAFTAAQTAAMRSQSANNLKQILLAIHNFAYANGGRVPAPVLYGGAKKSIPYSWRVAILPFIEQNELYKQYNFDEPWDGPNNRKLLDRMPSIYSYPCPGGGATNPTHASYFVLAGEAGALGIATPGKGARGSTFADITDGTSNTIMVIEARRDIPWTKPEDIPFDVNGPLPELGGFDPSGFNAAFADGSVRTISKMVNPQVLRALITRAGGEVINNDALDAGPRPTGATTVKP
jgi:hypothetical protein